ncbi:thioesterase family protein [Halobacteriovorax sp. JY17]|uniref:acyl-CoA thioesterase n=1 Tax=Halobacteriovorax sp. JY17 TaxID=2014617 RepID=UPI000C528FC9|nr:thioesterase family protein [Halobacteriovorax sp. JY17]PIK15636.1 MAG: esterase [Halobacteriovorax sp. JY17]
MERVKFKIENSPFFIWKTDLHVSHMNYGNHLANDKVLTLCHEARVRWLRELGHSELNIFGNGLIQSDAMVMYKSQGHIGDEISVEISLGDFNSKAFDLYYKIVNLKANSEIARIKTGMLNFNYQEGSITSAHEDFLKYLEGL